MFTYKEKILYNYIVREIIQKGRSNMKKVRSLLIILLVAVLVIPFSVRAEKETETEKEETTKEPVKVYLFRGEGCGYCASALEWFDSIEEEYGDYFDIVSYEVWYDTENQALMEEVAAFKGDNASGVPYILVGEYSYPNGFAADTALDSSSDKTMGDQLIERILEVYESDERYDVMTELNNKPDYSGIVGTVAIILIAGITAFAIVSRIQNKN